MMLIWTKESLEKLNEIEEYIEVNDQKIWLGTKINLLYFSKK